MSIPITEKLIRWLIAVGGVVTGVGSTVVGSWISSRIHVYQENRKAHLDEIKQKVLVPLKETLIERYTGLVKHKASAVIVGWGTRKRIEGVSVVQQQTEDGPFLLPVLPDIRCVVDSALYADAKKKHFISLIRQLEALDEAWRAHAHRCHAWVVRLSDAILAKSGLGTFPAVALGTPFVNPFKLAVYSYRRLFRVWDNSLLKHCQNPAPAQWVIEGFDGTSACGTEEQMTTVVAVLDELMVTERNNADELMAEARKLDQNLAALVEEIEYAIAYRRIRKRCDLVPFF